MSRPRALLLRFLAFLVGVPVWVVATAVWKVKRERAAAEGIFGDELAAALGPVLVVDQVLKRLGLPTPAAISRGR